MLFPLRVRLPRRVLLVFAATPVLAGVALIGVGTARLAGVVLPVAFVASMWYLVRVSRRHDFLGGEAKGEYGMTHGAAHRVSLLARQAEAPHDDTGDPTAALYAGKKAAARPIHEALMQAVAGFGDVTVAPKKGYLSLRRRKQFAMIQPSTTGRVDVGLILKGQPAEGRLEPAAGFNALFTHRVRLAAVAQVDDELAGWLRLAYDQAG